MTKLEEEIADAVINEAEYSVGDLTREDIGRAAASVARTYIEKAYREGWDAGGTGEPHEIQETLNFALKEWGVISSEENV